MADLNELIEKTADMSDAFYSAELTDSYSIGIWASHEPFDEDRILEIRVFNEKKEVKLFREDIGDDFHLRVRTDDGDYYDECQFLDIDTRHSDGNVLTTTGGGRYTVPESILEMAEPMLRVRYYLKQEESSGQTYISDWRCVGFEDRKETANG